jgi:putative FmdB family regulatory protein
MPTYEYICAKCDHHFEKVQPMTAAALTVCPKELCGMKKWGKGKVKRAIGGGGGLIFKGSGFYITDYRSEGYKAAAKKDSGGGENKPAGETKSGGESKPAGESKSSGEGKSSGESKPPAAKAESKPPKAKSSSDK